MNKGTLVVNLCGGPGTGKSTTSAGVFFDLKTRGVNCELVSEFAKDLTWEERQHTLENQIYIFGKQHHRIFRLLGKVSVIVTDSPIILSIVYDGKKSNNFKNLVFEEFDKMWTYNVFIERKKAYNSSGRNQDEAAAKDLDVRILTMLNANNVAFDRFDGNIEGKDKIVSKILDKIFWDKNEKI